MQVEALLIKNDTWGYVSGEIPLPEEGTGTEALAAEARRKGNLSLANSSLTSVKGKGTVRIVAVNENDRRLVEFKDTLYVPDLRNNLVSVSKITDKGYSVAFKEDVAVLSNPNGEEIAALKAPKVALRPKRPAGIELRVKVIERSLFWVALCLLQEVLGCIVLHLSPLPWIPQSPLPLPEVSPTIAGGVAEETPGKACAFRALEAVAVAMSCLAAPTRSSCLAGLQLLQRTTKVELLYYSTATCSRTVFSRKLSLRKYPPLLHTSFSSSDSFIYVYVCTLHICGLRKIFRHRSIFRVIRSTALGQ
ncbi:hypothetical protein J437_LFUL014703 [Ladona fulva]|uniref:Retrovirus-related Pol polyprotein from transposon TNT 1-94-like beta-barrel domain-containing protein n=1 Tax=Ladona fulva TaxID=123851 RepID=A0A8K0KIH1_LADFU|nr:hypothetical protein J437_LFUL014703 [Ladona fulva]